MCQLRNVLLWSASAVLILAGGAPDATGDAPCGDLDECRVLIEINSSDGDIGFHVLLDAEGWWKARIDDPEGQTIFQEHPNRELRDQKLTENFFESAEPVCEERLKEEEDDEVVTLAEFLERFASGPYDFEVKLEGGERLSGTTILTHNIPAAPAEVDFDGSVISWEYGDDLGECTTLPDGFTVAPEEDIVGYDVVLEPEAEALSGFKFTVQVPRNGPSYSVTVPPEYLNALPLTAPLKVEVGAIEERPNGSFGNQTFTEEDGFCNNADQELCAGGA
jgi:hypothetical protein